MGRPADDPQVSSAGESDRLGTRALRGMFWAYGSYVGGRALVLVSTALLARLLGPSDFGLVALALVFIAFLDTLSDLGLTQALVIASDDELETKASTVWLSSVAIGIALSLAIAALGPVAASFFHESALKILMPVLGLNQFLRSLGTTHYALAQKRLQFRTRTVAEFADVLVRALTGIGLAIAGAGAYALVIGYLVGTIALVVTLWIMVPWRPSWDFHREHLVGLVGFGGALTAVGILGAVMGSADDLIVGRVLGTTELGLYNIAYRLPELLIINLSLVAGQVLFPAMASVAREDLPAAFLRSLRLGLMIGLPISVGLGVMASSLVVALFGDQWRAAGPAMQVMALWTLMSPIGIIIGTAYKALGRADILLKLAIPQAIILVVSVLAVAHHGIVAVSACQAAIAIVFTLVAMAVAARMLDVPVRTQLVALWPALFASAGLAIVLLAADRLMSGPWPTLLVGFAAGAPAYGGLLWLVARDTLRQLLATARPGRATPAPVGPAV